MFDWFRELGEELGGIDSIAAKNERKKKQELKKLNCYIFSGSTKVLISALGVLYVVMSTTAIVALKDMKGTAPLIAKHIVMSIIAMVVVLGLIFGKKKGEIVALVGIFIFCVGLFLSISFMV